MDGEKDWKRKTPQTKEFGEKTYELRECSIASIPAIVVKTIRVAVPLPITGVPVDVDRELS